MRWPSNYYFDKFKPDAQLLQKAFLQAGKSKYLTIADQVFANQKNHHYLNLKHLANLFYERCRLHSQHIKEIEHRHIKTQEELFGLKLTNLGSNARRISGLESQLLQLEKEKREEELAFWKDSADLRQKLFEAAAAYKTVKNRYSILSGLEGEYGRPDQLQ